ncbi:YafY family protein [Bacillus spongiae]|uniref:YafY family protein n=1 Tax=Bacillus spongiae TaxID=2683610 RepID=A0ABU8HC62_9BACI
MSKGKRLLEILLYATTKKRFTAQEIADEFNISIRTVHRYILDLSDMGLPITAEQGRNGGYSVITNNLLPPLLFTNEEAVSIFFAFQSLRFYRNLPFDTEIHAVTHKLYRSLQQDAKRKVDKLQSYIAFWSPVRPVDTPLLRDVLEHCIENREMTIQYESKSGINTKHLRPIGIYAHNGLWYMPALDYLKEKVLLYRVDRIVSILSTEENNDPFMNLEEWFSSKQEERAIRFHVILSMEGVRECKSDPFFDGMVVTNKDGTGYIDSVIDKGNIRFIAPFFYRMGHHARILEPRELIHELCLQAQEILNFYQNGD